MSCLPDELRVVNCCGNTTVPQLFSIVAGSVFVVGNDTGTAHVAGVLEIPQVVISGGGHYGLYFPNGKYRHAKIAVLDKMPCVRCNFMCAAFDGVYPCIAQVGTDTVLELMRRCAGML